MARTITVVDLHDLAFTEMVAATVAAELGDLAFKVAELLIVQEQVKTDGKGIVGAIMTNVRAIFTA
jgi:hypothetical protein